MAAIQPTVMGYRSRGPPRQAALQPARRPPDADSEADAKSDPTEATIRSAASGHTFAFDARVWTGEPGESEEWDPGEATAVSVAAERSAPRKARSRR